MARHKLIPILNNKLAEFWLIAISLPGNLGFGHKLERNRFDMLTNIKRNEIALESPSEKAAGNFSVARKCFTCHSREIWSKARQQSVYGGVDRFDHHQNVNIKPIISHWHYVGSRHIHGQNE